MEGIVEELRAREKSEHAAWLAERAQLQGRHEATENRWIREVDHARQEIKARDEQLRIVHKAVALAEQQRGELCLTVERLRAQVTTLTAVREQLEHRLIAKDGGKSGPVSRTQRPPSRKPRAARRRVASPTTRSPKVK